MRGNEVSRAEQTEKQPGCFGDHGEEYQGVQEFPRTEYKRQGARGRYHQKNQDLGSANLVTEIGRTFIP